jgi:hypothetical protein
MVARGLGWDPGPLQARLDAYGAHEACAGNVLSY